MMESVIRETNELGYIKKLVLKCAEVSVVRPHRSTASCDRCGLLLQTARRSVVCLSFGHLANCYTLVTYLLGHDRQPCKNG